MPQLIQTNNCCKKKLVRISLSNGRPRPSAHELIRRPTARWIPSGLLTPVDESQAYVDFTFKAQFSVGWLPRRHYAAPIATYPTTYVPPDLGRTRKDRHDTAAFRRSLSGLGTPASSPVPEYSHQSTNSRQARRNASKLLRFQCKVE
ncbi:hypothetical protein PGT21_003909 [Puccinia graminis f. sp. tritici]|uniref:Uncharacterized protein n=1 Tax=Puccinia graminis f. sp. tritici TaxID=56615 RepID=A0A5B0QZK6_PUCGR|nr:hypothetical protein PGT21_003909 [Puccinia graminis f. sp. tritici]KAA1135327.1 hypothetical protein PGTUg99_011410 [Puccinia graminis f. sp. tritici]